MRSTTASRYFTAMLPRGARSALPTPDTPAQTPEEAASPSAATVTTTGTESTRTSTTTTTTRTSATTQTSTSTSSGETTTTTMAVPLPTLSRQAQDMLASSRDDPRRLRKAIERGNLAQVQAVLAQGAAALLLNGPLAGRASALQLAARHGHVAIVLFLLERYALDVNQANGQGRTPLHEAAYAGHVEVVAALLNQGANALAVIPDGLDMPLHLALMGQHAQVAALLLERGAADVHTPRAEGVTPFYLAIENGMLDTAERLRLQGSDMNQRTHGGWVPALKACFDGPPDTVRWLRQQGADFRPKKVPEKWTFMHMAAMNVWHLGVMNFLRQDLPANAFSALALMPDHWDATPGGLAAERGQPADFILGLQVRAVDMPLSLAPTTHRRSWLILGGEQADWSFDSVIQHGTQAGIEMHVHGDGNMGLAWAAIKALTVQPGDSVALLCHADWNSEFHRVMVQLGEHEVAPLTEVTRVLFEKGVLNMLLLGCRATQGRAALKNRFQLDPQIPRPVRSGYEGLSITIVGAGGDTLTSLNREAIALWLEDSGTYLKTGVKGDALQRLCVPEMHTLGWHGGQLEWRTRAALDADTLSGVTPAQSDHVKSQLLFMHANEGRLEAVRALVTRHGVDPNAQNEIGTTVLHLASERDHANVVAFLLAQPDVGMEVPDKQGRTALWTACHSGHADVVRLLLAHDANVDVEALNGKTPLWVACRGNRERVVDQLLTHGVDVEMPDNEGWTPLHVACRWGHLGVVESLLNMRADVTARTLDGETPWDLAQAHNQNKIIALLNRTSSD